MSRRVEEKSANVVGLLLALLLLLLPGAAAAQGTGTIQGQVTTIDGAELPAELEVELLFLPNGQGPPIITTQPLSADGAFAFSDLETSAEHRYLVRVTVEEQDNLSELLAFTEGQSSLDVSLRLMERTTDPSALSVGDVNYIMDVRADGWIVAALYSFENSGEQIIENLTNPPATIPLPAQATNVQFADESIFEGVTETTEGFAFSGPFPPGETAMVFSYLLPYQQGEQEITLPLGAEAAQLRILIPQLGQRTESLNLGPAGTQEAFEGRTFEVYEAENPSASQTFTFRFTGLPPAPAPTTPVATDEPRILPISLLEQLPWWAPLVPVAISVAGVAAYLYARPTPGRAEQLASLRSRRDTLLAEIASLDIRFEAGAVGEQTHRRQRELLKRELKDVLRRLRGDELAAGGG